MVRMADLSENERKRALGRIKDLPEFKGRAIVKGPPLSQRRLAIITTSGIHRAGDTPFSDGDAAAEYRVIPGNVRGDQLVMSHLSINFDRTGFQQDMNVVFPIDRVNELVADGTLGSVADFHFAFMGAAPIPLLKPRAQQLAGLLKKDGVDAVLLSPV